jgi:uncharacterized protein (DUF39 family)
MGVGIGVPIPILNEEIMEYAAVRDEDLYCPIVDYNEGYPLAKPMDLGFANMKDLRSGKITIQGKQVVTTPQSSYARARQIAGLQKEWIQKGSFTLSEPAAFLPSAQENIVFKSLPVRKANGHK